MAEIQRCDVKEFLTTCCCERSLRTVADTVGVVELCCDRLFWALWTQFKHILHVLNHRIQTGRQMLISSVMIWVGLEHFSLVAKSLKQPRWCGAMLLKSAVACNVSAGTDVFKLLYVERNYLGKYMNTLSSSSSSSSGFLVSPK